MMKKNPAWFSGGGNRTIAALLLAAAFAATAGGEPPAGPADRKTSAPAQPATQPAPAPYRARYSVVTSGATVAEAVYTLARSEQGWEFQAHARPSGMVSLFIDTEVDEYSLLEIDGARVRPLRYRYSQKPDKEQDGKILRAQFDWQAGKVTVTDGDKTRLLPIDAGAQDPLSVQMALMQCMKTGCTDTDHAVLDEMKLQSRRFERAGAETLDTALGQFETVKLSYRRGKRETVTWLAPGLNHIPVRIRQYRNNKLKSEMRITAVDFE